MMASDSNCGKGCDKLWSKLKLTPKLNGNLCPPLLRPGGGVRKKKLARTRDPQKGPWVIDKYLPKKKCQLLPMWLIFWQLWPRHFQPGTLLSQKPLKESRGKFVGEECRQVMCAKSTTYPKKKCHLRLEPEAKSAHKEERRQGQLSRERAWFQR